jgi:hypothetical protein
VSEVWKFVLGPPGAGHVSRIATDGGKIRDVLAFGEQDSELVCWAWVEPEEGFVSYWRFVVVNTGVPLPSVGEHLATVSVPVPERSGPVVWHIFEEGMR